MIAEGMLSPAVETDDSRLYRIGGIAAVALGVAYLIIFPLYAYAGAPPSGADAWLTYVAGKTTVWWAILGLSVLTDFLLVPIALALYFALGRADRNAMLLGTAFIGLFIVLDLAVTWPNYAALITLGDAFAAATTDAQRAASVTAAMYPSAVVSSTLEGVYSILSLSVGILLVSLVMRSAPFARGAAYVGIATGILGIVSVAGPLVFRPLGGAIIVASILTTVWVLLVGYRLYRLGEQ